ncbi:MAG: prephenate dehydrogenase [Candidatus Riflebacteria bacterium]|nr:prephenate dehydrogenase [Candidatus Riflebacteria bacterium]
MKVAIIGLGLIGGSIGLDLRARGFARRILGSDVSREHADKALELSLVDEVLPLEAAVPSADLIILGLPVDAILETLPRVLELASGNATVTDVGSTKDLICKSVEGHFRRRQFVPAHPMAGTEHSGPSAALQGLFDQRVAVICNRDASDLQHLQRVEKMYSVLGMRLVYMTSMAHDLHVAFVSHLSHISSFVLANTVLDQEKNTATIFDLASGGFESTVRLAKSSPDMWAPIFRQNLSNVTAALDSYIEHLQDFRESLVEGRRTRGLMEQANEIGRILTRIQTPDGGNRR